jgi:hypothetical protein
MTVFCGSCNREATYVEPENGVVPYMENGHYECHNPECGNGGRCAEASNPESYRMNGYYVKK